MRIVCPSCFAAYKVPETLATAGKKLKCIRCGTLFASPAQPAPAPAPDTMPEPPLLQAAEPLVAPQLLTARDDAALAGRPGYPHRQRGRGRQSILLAVLCLLCIGALWAAYAYRTDIAAAWPASQRLYIWLHIAG